MLWPSRNHGSSITTNPILLTIHSGHLSPGQVRHLEEMAVSRLVFPEPKEGTWPLISLAAHLWQVSQRSHTAPTILQLVMVDLPTESAT
ncbi:MAG: hypothetical protein BWY29_00457 [Microgenomates group bacterium ADurb.Bin238]|nr:MAG: hypothetical protein BWY29_00457 [Microgenomates group bacterium ADurb.Bin238]